MLVVLAFVFLFALSAAQRPENASLCDYYASQLYGNAGNASQAKLVQSILSLAFGGPPPGFPNASSDLTGILNPGTIEGIPVDLRPWFNGSKDSTNLNNAPIGIDWLDGGGMQPLFDFINGVTDTPAIDNKTNQFRLFNHFFVAFSHVFDCSNPIPPAKTQGDTGGTQRLSLAYVHKYMDLNHTDLGHFIDQLGRASTYYGFSQQDASVLTGNLNTQFNVRCAPPTGNPPQLLSLCQDPTCPLAADPDCEPYKDLQPGGLAISSSSGSPASSSTTAPSSSFTSSPASTTSSSSTSATTTSTPTNTATSPASNSNKLSGGAIAGIAIGGAVVGLMAIGLGLFFFKRRTHKPSPSETFSPSSAYISPAYTDPHASYVSSSMHSPMQQAHMNVNSWNGPPPPMPISPTPIAEMDSPHYKNSPEMATSSNQWQSLYPKGTASELGN